LGKPPKSCLHQKNQPRMENIRGTNDPAGEKGRLPRRSINTADGRDNWGHKKGNVKDVSLLKNEGCQLGIVKKKEKTAEARGARGGNVTGRV